MKLGLLALLLVACATTKGIVKDPQRLKNINRLAIFPFTCDGADVGNSIADSLTTKLMESRFQIIERSQLDRIFTEQGLSLAGVLDSKQYMFGEIRGIDAIIVGSATVSGLLVKYISEANARIIDLRTGEILMAVTFRASSLGTQRGIITPMKAGYWIGNEIIKKTE